MNANEYNVKWICTIQGECLDYYDMTNYNTVEIFGSNKSNLELDLADTSKKHHTKYIQEYINICCEQYYE